MNDSSLTVSCQDGDIVIQAAGEVTMAKAIESFAADLCYLAGCPALTTKAQKKRTKAKNGPV